MFKRIFFVTMPFLITGCFTVHKTFDVSGKSEMLLKKEALANILVDLSKSEADISARFDNIHYPLKFGKEKIYLKSKEPTEVKIKFSNLDLIKRKNTDIIYLKPKADKLGIEFVQPLPVRRKNNRFYVNKVVFDSQKEEIRLKAQIRLLSFFVFGNKMQIDHAPIPPVQAAWGNLTTTVIGLTTKVDAHLGGGKDLADGCQNDLFWNGSSQINSGGNSNFGMRSNVRYEHWTCGTFKIPIFQKTADIDYNIIVRSSDGDVFCSVDVTNLRGVSGAVEDIIENWFSIELGKTLNLSLKNYLINLKKTDFTRASDKDLKINANFELIYQLDESEEEISGNFWKVSYGGTGKWRRMAKADIPVSELEFGDFDGDKITDVFSTKDGQWRYSSGGKTNWINIATSTQNLYDLRFGDFDGDGRTDVFSTKNGQWRYSSAGKSEWINIATSTQAIYDLRLGDFDGDSITDVFSTKNGQWRYSSAGKTEWINIATSTQSIDELRFGDFDGDGRTDVFSTKDGQWRYSSAGKSEWINLETSKKPLTELRFGYFDKDKKCDVFKSDTPIKERENLRESRN